MSNGPAFVANARPNPTKGLSDVERHPARWVRNMDSLMKRAPINIATDTDATCSATPASIITDPRNKAARRPSKSDANGVKGIACITDRKSANKNKGKCV